MKRFFALVSIIALFSIGSYNTSAAPKAKVGKTLPAWSKGCLDIHFINSGRGECCFYILPDGTTLIVDAGELTEDKGSVAQRPNDNVRPYITYAN